MILFDEFDWLILGIKIAAVVLVLLQVVPIMVWVERRGSALMQNRLGPNRVGPLGLFQSLADVIKFLWKEDPIPGHVEKFYYVLAPLILLVPAFMTFAVIPFAGTLEFQGKIISFQMTQLNVGILYLLSITSLGVYGIMMAGWASRNKYTVLGSLRSSAQMISYELAMGLSIVGILLTYSTVQLEEMVLQQGQWITQIGPYTLPEFLQIPRWGIFLQPIGFLLFLVSAFAETNRLPFDLPEGESEIIAGYHLEYGAMKFALFMMAEYLNMTTASAVIATLYFGGWQLFPGMGSLLTTLSSFFHLSGLAADVLRIAFELTSFSLKVGFFMWFFVWVRWTLPRFRYDQLMDLGWKVLLPLGLVNIFITSTLIYLGWL